MATLDVNPELYQAQLADKIALLKAMFVNYSMPELEVFESPVANYRMRAEFRIWHEGDDMYYIMFNQETREKYRVDQFPAASRLINDLMPLLMDAMKGSPILRHKLFQVDFLSTLSGEILVSLLYHRQLSEEWITAAQALKQRLNDEGFNLNLIGRARKMKVVLDRDYVVEKLQVNGQPYVYKQVENSFTQPNAKVAEKMLEWAV
ncbi:TPA: tRNA (uridine(54)-C5)-methyltransferase TrmA, partial [Vibrio cholerae]